MTVDRVMQETDKKSEKSLDKLSEHELEAFLATDKPPSTKVSKKIPNFKFSKKRNLQEMEGHEVDQEQILNLIT